MSKPTPGKIMTLTPDPIKKGVNIDMEKYDFMRSTILEVLDEKGPLSSGNLVEAVCDHINAKGGVPYSIGWYTMAVRLDLEARGEVLYNRGDKKPLVSLPAK